MGITNPTQTILVSCRGNAKDKFSSRKILKDNLFVLDWHMQTSFEPFLFAISVGKTRFSHQLIKESRVFAVNFMQYSLKDKVLYCGRRSGEHIDKFNEAGLTKQEAETIDCCRVKESLAFIECEVMQEIETGDHTIFVAKVTKQEEKEPGKRLFHLGGDNFTTTKD